MKICSQVFSLFKICQKNTILHFWVHVPAKSDSNRRNFSNLKEDLFGQVSLQNVTYGTWVRRGKPERETNSRLYTFWTQFNVRKGIYFSKFKPGYWGKEHAWVFLRSCMQLDSCCSKPKISLDSVIKSWTKTCLVDLFEDGSYTGSKREDQWCEKSIMEKKWIQWKLELWPPTSRQSTTNRSEKLKRKTIG